MFAKYSDTVHSRTVFNSLLQSILSFIDTNKDNQDTFPNIAISWVAAIFNDISNNNYIFELFNQYTNCRTTDFSSIDLHIKLSKTDGSGEYLTGYLGKKNNKVYFISDRNYIKYDISSSDLIENAASADNTFTANTFLNMSLYDYGFNTKLKIC